MYLMDLPLMDIQISLCFLETHGGSGAEQRGIHQAAGKVSGETGSLMESSSFDE